MNIDPATYQAYAFEHFEPRALEIIDTTLRDGQQSLWAYNMRTGMIVPIVEYIDAAGFEALSRVVVTFAAVLIARKASARELPV